MGRQRKFDEEDILFRAMELFWIRGYEATSIQHLETHLGVGKRSLYNTFGNKENLFIEALKRYQALALSGLQGLDETENAKQAIRDLYLRRIEFVASKDGWRGCLMTNTAVELAPHNPRVAKQIKAMLKDTENALFKTIRRGQNNRQLSANLDARMTAVFLTQNVLGFNAFAKVSPGTRNLKRSAEITLSVLDAP